jgi:type I restriction enzyme S subunit
MRKVLLADILQESRSGFWGAEAGAGGADVRVIRNGDVQDGGVRWDALPLRGVSVAEADRAEIRQGDILMTTSGNCGYSAYVSEPPSEPTIASNFVRILRFDTEKVVPRYIFHLIHSGPFRSLLSPYIRGTTLKNLSLSTAAERIDVPLPNVTAQRRIADILDKADALQAKRRAALAKLDSLPQSIFHDMFGDTRTEPTRWPTVPLENIVRETKLGLVRSSQEFGPDFQTPYVRMNAITRDGELELKSVHRTHATDAEIEAYRLEPGDLLFNTRNSEELVGKTALFRGGGLHIFNNNVMRIRLTADAHPEFVAAAFKTAFVQHELDLRKSGTTNVFAIYYKDLRSLPLPLPPIQLQRDFESRVAAVRKWKTAQKASHEGFESLFAALQHRAFSGQL